MKADGSNATSKVGTKPTTTQPGNDVAKNQPSFKDWLMSKADNFRDLIPSGTVDLNRFIKAAIIEITNNPKLMGCTRESIIMSIGQCARYGLEPGALLGQAWLIPYTENKMVNGQWQKIPTCHFQLGYKGLIALARRSNTIQTISAEPVYQGDVDSGRFLVELGTERKLIHKPDFFGDRGEVIGYYAAVKLTNGETQFAIMSKKDVANHRDRFSKVVEKKSNDKDGKYKSKESVWDSDFDSMALKTVIIKTLKLCPISIEAMEAINQEEAEESGRVMPSTTAADTIMGEYEPSPVDEDIYGEPEEKQEVKPAETMKPAQKPSAGPTDEEIAKELAEQEAASEDGLDIY